MRTPSCKGIIEITTLYNHNSRIYTIIVVRLSSSFIYIYIYIHTLNHINERVAHFIQFSMPITIVITMYILPSSWYGHICLEGALKSMIWYNRFGIYHLFKDVPISLSFIIIPYIIIYEHSHLASLTLYITWVH